MGDRILIVDDEKLICSVLARRLNREGYFCVMAHNGREALNHFYTDAISLIISDIKMPEIDGIEFLKRVKEMNPKMTVIMMTAYPDIDVAVDAMRAGAYDFITKPVDLDLVVLRVKKALEKKKLEEELEAYHKNLERLVEERTAEIRQALSVVKKNHLDLVMVLSGAIDAKDTYTRGHSDRVRRMSVRIGMKLGFDEKRLESLVFGALLHDIGKIGIKDEVLQKQGNLNSEEYQYIQEHPLIGVKIVEGIDFFKDKIPIIRNHHEHFDGSGYPDGLIGEAIPLEARTVAVPDAFDAMTSSRPHHEGMSLEEALSEMERGRGRQFDPKILGIFLGEEIYRLNGENKGGSKNQSVHMELQVADGESK
ncbi:MAG TPA: HD domain-containing phosphohydrolase [Thermodesulfobacteriota bacterium]|nr:HD domain-containing phosphohydrolase [Thermodesulfobacteriota bacterium]